ncbi:protein SGT1 homolog B-like [Telopea speciosissima]|uniref:protein SGT1 homolog B-like n=1 Tax=Telopea speciosissima TaxID=54955 RepID=UPI001CC33A42|nr:protein SGT1 homolog B-like [Telopea speciosissima]
MYSLNGISHEFYGAFLKLEVLEIDGMPCLEKWTAIKDCDMPSLRQLTIVDCPKLVTLPEFLNLKSLEHLRITLCPEIQSFPGERLPESLQSLTITECVKLEEQCWKEEGDEWCKIAGIPEIWIDYQQIYLTEAREHPTGERLAESFQSLTNTDCAKLEEHSWKEEGEEWCKIAGIPEIWIDYQQKSQTEAREMPTGSWQPTVPSAVTPVGSHLSDGTVNDSSLSQNSQPTLVTPAKPKYRHEYYQKPEAVVVTIFAKGIPSKNVAVEFGVQFLRVSIDVPGEDSCHFQIRLFGNIIPEKCRYDVFPTKVEIWLAKAEAINWTSLEFRREQKIKLEAQVKEDKKEKLDGDVALNKLFRDIYQEADEDTRRAMRKSFVESHGAVLSTNWKEGGAKKVEGSRPEGMDQLKKWE